MTKTAKPTAKKATAKKATAKKIAPKKTAPKESTESINRDDFVSSWRLKTNKSMADLGTEGKQTVGEDVFPSYCRAAGMQHKQVVRAVEIVRGFAHEAKTIADTYITDNSKEIGDNKISIAFPVTGLDDGRGGVPRVIIEHQAKGVKVNTPDGEVYEDLKTTVTTVHMGPTRLGRLTD